MTTWTSDELNNIGTAEELEIASRRHDGTLRNSVTIWVVRHGDDLYVRAVNGCASVWFRGVQDRHEGHIQAGGVDAEGQHLVVSFLGGAFGFGPKNLDDSLAEGLDIRVGLGITPAIDFAAHRADMLQSVKDALVMDRLRKNLGDVGTTPQGWAKRTSHAVSR